MVVRNGRSDLVFLRGKDRRKGRIILKSFPEKWNSGIDEEGIGIDKDK